MEAFAVGGLKGFFYHPGRTPVGEKLAEVVSDNLIVVEQIIV